MVGVDKIFAELRQTHSAHRRTWAIRQFAKALRREDRFRPAWDGIGGASGLASLMAEFSVRDVRTTCTFLGRTAAAQKARTERRAELSELVRLVYDEPVDDRPLRAFYQDIVPACSLELVEEWEAERGVKWTRPQLERLFRGHRERYEDKFLEDIFSPDAEDLTFAKERRLFCGNLPFNERILVTLVTKDVKAEVQIPSDFVDELIKPLFKYLLKRTFNDDMRNKFLHLVVQCFQKYEDSLAKQLNLWQGGLIQYTIQRWHATSSVDSKAKADTKGYLVQLISLLPAEKRPVSLDSIYQALLVNPKLGDEARYELLFLFLRHLKRYKIDIEDESKSGIARLKEMPVADDVWPATLFFTVAIEKALPLFEKLDAANPRSDFLAAAPGNGPRTVLKQWRTLHDSRVGDVEVVRSLLIRKSRTKIGQEDSAWFARARTLVNERRKNAEQSREPQERAFWAKSALNLCVAAGDLEIFQDTVLWARRFNKDSLTIRELYSTGIFETKELQDLLGAMPQWDTQTPVTAETVVPVLLKKDIDLSNRIVINLIETAGTTTQEPDFQRSRWTSVLRLPEVVANRRLNFFKNKTKSSPSENVDAQVEIAEKLWKPTVDMLVEAEALLRRPSSAKLISSSRNVGARGLDVFQQLADGGMSAPLLADLANFLLSQMRARLGAEGLRVQVHDTVDVVVRVARCDQPALACPLIRDLVIDGDGDENISAWHRQLLSVQFLSSLPAKAAKELLFTMASAMKERMRDQNLNWRQKSDNETSRSKAVAVDTGGPEARCITPNKSHSPAIKVTTIKMIAQLLQNNLFINTSSSCDILISLLAEARHTDMLTAFTSSLIHAMEEPTCPPQLRMRILDALETYVVPVAAQLSERHPLTEDDWSVAAKDSANLPAVGEEASLWAMLVDKAHSAKLDPDDMARLAQLIMTIPEQSAANNDRWIKLFLAKNNFTLGDDERIPTIPVSLEMLASLFSDLMPYMPASIFRVLRSIVLTNLDPPPGISRVTESVKANRDLVNSKAGKHWLALFDNPADAALGLFLQHAALALQSPPEMIEAKLGDGKAITVQILQDFILSAAERLVITGNTGVLESLVSKLCQRRFEGRQHWESWRTNCISVIKNIIGRVEGVRIHSVKDKQPHTGIRGTGIEWTRGRRPVMMPNTFLLSIKALPIPYSSSKDPASAEEIEDFVSRLSDLIDWLTERKLPYHVDLARLKDEVCRVPRFADLARYGIKLAGLHNDKGAEELSLADYLRFEMVGEFLIKSGDLNDESVIRERSEIVRGLTGSEAEVLRMMGFNIIQKLESQGIKLGLTTDGKEE